MPMRALVLENLEMPTRVADIAVPDIGPDEYLVRVAAASLNAFDWKVAAGMMAHNFDYDFPVTIGRDFAGRIEAAGSAASRFSVGEEVFGYLSSTRLHHGSIAEFVATGNACMVAKPVRLDIASAAAVPLGGVTAMRCLEQLGLEHGRTVLIVGAAGGVGSFAVQLAARAGASVIATGLPEDNEYLCGLGASHVVDYRDDLEQSVREICPDGVDAVVDLVNRGEDFLRSARLAASGGAAVSTHRQADSDELAELGVRGVNVGGTPDPDLLAELGRLAADGEISVPVSGTFSLEQAADGLARIRDEHVRGKYVIAVSSA
jgi:NADPH:quinone reductase